MRLVRVRHLRHAAASFLLEPVQRAAADRMDDLLRQVTPGSGA